MIKTKIAVFMAILILALSGCEKTEQEPLIVYSFSGEDASLAVSNGVIVLNGTEEIFSGGDLNVTGELFADITSYSTEFYTMSGDEKNVILSNRVEDMSGGTVHVSGDLGQVSGDRIIRSAKTDDNGDWNRTLYFELTTEDKNGTESVYSLQMSLTEITQNDNN